MATRSGSAQSNTTWIDVAIQRLHADEGPRDHATRVKLSGNRLIALEPMSLDERDLAVHSGTNVERVRRMVELGIVPPPGEDGNFRAKDMLRVRVALAL